MNGKRAKKLRKLTEDAFMIAAQKRQRHFSVNIERGNKTIAIISPDPRWSYRRAKESYNRLKNFN